MEEKTYCVMKRVGGSNIAIGVLFIVAGLTLGILAIVNGGKLLKNKGNILF